MKAYYVWDRDDDDLGKLTVVFATTVAEARIFAYKHSEYFDDTPYLSIRARRYPELDGQYRGRREMDWDDPEDRKALCANGWYCYDAEPGVCENCPGKILCWVRGDERS